MKAKYHIYNYLLFLSFVVLFAGSMVGCSNDPVMKEETTSGKTMLSITVRGITITEPKDGNYDDYVKTLRVIGYDDAGNTVCNTKYNDLSENSNVAQIELNGETFYKISNLELQGFAGGRCYLYFIANEEDYTISVGNKNSLGNGITDAPEKSDLEGGKITFNATDNKELGTFPILMTAQSVALIKGGIEQEITEPIELVRCVAKFKLIINGDQNTYTIGQVTVTGYSPNNYTLWDDIKYTNYTNSNYSKFVNNNVDSGHLFSSSEIYFPEKLYGSQIDYSGLLRFNIPVTRNGILKTYEVEIGDDVDNGNYNIQRNTIYTIIATLGWTPTFTVQVNSWNEKTMEIPAFE